MAQFRADYRGLPDKCRGYYTCRFKLHLEKRPGFTYASENSKGKKELMIPGIEVPKYYATVRTDTEEVLGVVGKDYNVVQNVDAFSFLIPL